MKINDIIKNKDGVALLLVTVIITAVALILTVKVTALGLGELEMIYIVSQADESFAVADGCMEETLRRIQIDKDYGVGEGIITINLGAGSCDITVAAAEEERTIDVHAAKNEYNKKLRVTLSLTGGRITINSWEELDI